MVSLVRSASNIDSRIIHPSIASAFDLQRQRQCNQPEEVFLHDW